jgi:hypothetical protein
MYRIDRLGNSIQPLKRVSFRELGFRERAHLQEWIAREPMVLGEELLIIQKEFAGFSDTSERLDLLALDKQGSLVIIENKLDDTGRDVTWQALKYASYCSRLTKDDIRSIYQEYLDRQGSETDAAATLSAFFDDVDYAELSLNKGISQRIILVAANFRKEVTSTVLWLSNFRVRLQCFRATPFALGDELFLNVEQIIPTKDAEEFSIGLADKAKDEVEGLETEARRHPIRRQFWTEVLAAMNATPSTLYQNISPKKESWISAGSGVRGLGFNFAATGDYARAELYIDRGDKAENEVIFDQLFTERAAIEAEIGQSVEWERLDARRACRIKIEQPGDIFDRDQWPEMIPFMVIAMSKLEKVLRPRILKTAGRLG